MKRTISVLLLLALVLSIGDTALAKTKSPDGSAGFTYSTYTEGDCVKRTYIKLKSYNGSACHIKIPAYISSCPVNIVPSRYKYPKKIKKITVPGKLRYQGEFASLPNLKAICVRKSAEYLYTKKGVLFKKSGILGVWLDIYPRGKKDKTYHVPEKVKGIGPYAFVNSKNLKSVKLPKGLLWIDAYAFKGCTFLKKIKIPKWVYYIGEGAFKKCKARVILPHNMKKVKGKKGEGAHYELFVDSRPKDDPDAPSVQVPYCDIEEIQPDTKTVNMKIQSTHKLVTHFQINGQWSTLLSDGLQYRSSNPKVATVNDHGVVTAKKKGTTKITVAHLDLYGYHSYAAGEYTVKITVK